MRRLTISSVVVVGVLCCLYSVGMTGALHTTTATTAGVGGGDGSSHSIPPPPTLPWSRAEFLAWLCPSWPDGGDCDEATDPVTTTLRIGERLLRDLAPFASLSRKHRPTTETPPAASNLPWWRFVPMHIGNMKPGESLPTFSTNCFDSVDVSVAPHIDSIGMVEVTLDLSNQVKKPDCMERYWFTIGAMSKTEVFEFSGKYRTFFNATDFNTAQKYDYENKGVRFYVFNDTQWQDYGDLLDTLLLFVPKITGKPDPVSTADNVMFFNQYSQIKPFIVPRNGTIVMLNESEINNGDLLFQSEMDGIGPSIAFSTGTTASHTAVFLRDTLFGDLNVCEAVGKGVRCTEYKTWIKESQAAGKATVFAPLNATLSASFDNTAAWDWMWRQIGLEYGYNNFLFGWIDTRQDNYPCFPPDFKRCLKWEHWEWFMLNLERLTPTLSYEFFGQALNHRLNQTNMSVAELLYLAESQLNMSSGDVLAIPEQDSWRYLTKKDGYSVTGRSMVCSVLACNVLRKGGVFSNIQGDLECAEQTPYDMSSMQIFDTSQWGSGRPQACIDADPANHLCQLTGDFTFHLNDGRNTRPPYKQMSNHCSSQNPGYNRGGPNC